ncbi:ATP-binding protein (plasmid) [Neorhizobium galegae]|nr:ATP-binding protein [Neorhizobium galegae]UIK08714.1 ATP-binding protein [Neorhizobium galegae]
MRTELVQKLQVARRELQLEPPISELDKFDLLILDDLTYVTKGQAETSVLFELISARYERRSIVIAALLGMEQGFTRSRHDARCCRSARPSRDGL